MKSGRHFLYNDKFFNAGDLVISADNRSFRYGDGFFETIKMVDGNIALGNYHFERLFSSLQLLKFERPDHFTAEYLSRQIKSIALKNNHDGLARIRLTIFRGNGGLYDHDDNSPNYIIQTWKLEPEVSMPNKKGLVTGIYTKAKKSCDDFSCIKSNNYLPYLMAAFWARENKLDDAIILNSHNCIADATIANIFLVKDGKIKTPALSEGCVNGVMRRHIIRLLKKENIPVEETIIQPDELAVANEVFLTNAIQGVKWIGKCEGYNYHSDLAAFLHNKLLLSL